MTENTHNLFAFGLQDLGFPTRYQCFVSGIYPTLAESENILFPNRSIVAISISISANDGIQSQYTVLCVFVETKVTQGHVQAVESADQGGGGMEIYSLLRSGWCVFFDVRGGRFFRLSWTWKSSSNH